MSRVMKYKNAPAGAGAALSAVAAVMADSGSFGITDGHTKTLVSMESVGDAQMAEFVRLSDDIGQQLRISLESAGFDELNPVQLEVACMMAMAAGSPVEYAQRALAGVSTISTEGITVVEPNNFGVAGSLDYRPTALPALEAFSEQELSNFLPMSIVYNLAAVRQDPFGEAFFRTVALSPDQIGLDLSVRKFNVYEEVRHNTTGKVTDFKFRNLIRAHRDHTILANEATTVVPYRLVDDTNAEYFVDEALVAPTVYVINGAEVPTAPLAMGKEIDLLGISQYPGLVGPTVTDSLDSLDGRIGLKAIYIQLNGDVGGTPTSEVIKFETARLPRSAFVKSVEGNYREMVLNFGTDALQITGDTKTVAGAASAILEAMITAGNTLRLGTKVTGDANVETGAVTLFSNNLSVRGLFDADGVKVSTDSGAGQTQVSAIESMTVIGYDLEARRSNADLRTRGLLLSPTIEKERHTIHLGAPISAPSPIGTNRDASDLTALIAATRVRNSNNAVTTLLNYADSLKAYVGSDTRPDAEKELVIEGIGRHLVTPFFEEIDLDVSTVLNSIKTHEKAADISAALVNAIRDLGYRMVRDSGYRQAVEMLTGGVAEETTLVIGTDQVLERFLMVSGDTRTTGIGLVPKVVSSPDTRMVNKIVLSLSRPGESEIDGLSPGVFAWVPELASTTQVTRNGATAKEPTVQPRSRHINTLPVMAVINVIGLTEALTTQTPTP